MWAYFWLYTQAGVIAGRLGGLYGVLGIKSGLACAMTNNSYRCVCFYLYLELFGVREIAQELILLFLFITGKGEDSDVLSINADAYDSDIEGPCNEEAAAPDVLENTVQSEAGPIDDLEKDIEKSVNEILGLAESNTKEPKAATLTVPPPEDVQPSAQQLELLELEMRARAIKALMKAGDIKKNT